VQFAMQIRQCNAEGSWQFTPLPVEYVAFATVCQWHQNYF